MTKIEQLKRHLLTGKSITPLEALGLYGIFRLAPRIHELRKQGWNIITTRKFDEKGSEYAEYRLMPKVNERTKRRKERRQAFEQMELA